MKQMVLEHKQRGKYESAAILPMAKRQSGKSKATLHTVLLLQLLLCVYTGTASI